MEIQVHINANGVHENLAEVNRRLASIFSAAEPLQELVAEDVNWCFVFERDPDGQAWEDLNELYAEWKSKVAPGKLIGELYGKMRAEENLRGTATEEPNRVSISYGVDPEAIEHAIKFQEGGLVTGTNQPQRLFFGLSQGGANLVGEMIRRQMTF